MFQVKYIKYFDIIKLLLLRRYYYYISIDRFSQKCYKKYNIVKDVLIFYLFLALEEKKRKDKNDVAH